MVPKYIKNINFWNYDQVGHKKDLQPIFGAGSQALMNLDLGANNPIKTEKDAVIYGKGILIRNGCFFYVNIISMVTT